MSLAPLLPLVYATFMVVLSDFQSDVPGFDWWYYPIPPDDMVLPFAASVIIATIFSISIAVFVSMMSLCLSLVVKVLFSGLLALMVALKSGILIRYSLVLTSCITPCIPIISTLTSGGIRLYDSRLS